MVITILDYVKTCQSDKEGMVIYDVIKPLLFDGQTLKISFKGIDAVPSSFINSAFIELLHDFDFDFIKKNLTFIHTNKLINELIKNRFHFEVFKRAPESK